MPHLPALHRPGLFDADAGHYVNQTAPLRYRTNILAPTGHFNCFRAVPHATNRMHWLINRWLHIVCLDADAGHYVDSTGQSSQTPCDLPALHRPGLLPRRRCRSLRRLHRPVQPGCAAGTYQTGQASCLDADPGHYVPTTGQTSQTPCPAGTLLAGSSSQDSCVSTDSGYYSENGSASQTACLPGTYQPSTGANCFHPVLGISSLHMPQPASPLDLGSYQPEAGQMDCISAQPGHYVPTAGQLNQTQCLLGTYQSSGQSSCIDASLGHYVPTNGSSSQTQSRAHIRPRLANPPVQRPLPATTFLPTGRHTDPMLTRHISTQHLTSRLTRHFTSGSASTSQTPCSLGHYQMFTGQSACEPAEPGHYVDSMPRHHRPLCRWDVPTHDGQTGCIDASPGYFVGQASHRRPPAPLGPTSPAPLPPPASDSG